MSVPTTSEANITAATVDILEQYSDWPESTPEVDRIEDVAQQTRDNRKGLSIYVWATEPLTIEEFDAEYSRTEDSATVQVLVMGMDSDETASTASRAIDLFQEYARDNGENTEFHSIKPTQNRDLRDEKNTRSTDHNIVGFQLQFSRLGTTGL